MDPVELKEYVRSLASQQGFESCRVARAVPIGRAEDLLRWLDLGRAGSMDYMANYFDQRVDPGMLLEGARSVVICALQYYQPNPAGVEEVGDSDQSRGRVARYAWGDDYHEVIKTKLFAMADQMRAELNTPFEAKACVDTAPLLEREWAATAGIGWIGKNTLVLNQQLGSYFFLGALVTTLEIEADEPVTDHCGSCTACLDACPTDAFPAPYEMDASRCISYLTIEHRDEIDETLKPMMGDWIFGCDVCQEVCPFNRDAPVTHEPHFVAQSHRTNPVLDEVLQWSIEDYRKQLSGSAMKRAKLDMLKRNAQIAQENSRSS